MSPVVVAAARLVAAFAAQAGLEEEDAARRLWGVCTYGGIGFIPKDEWVDLIDSRLLALLKFYKFGRIEGRLILAQALPQVNTYARMLGRAELSSQLAQALLSTQIKPRRWNSGEGEKVAAVRKRAGLVLPGKPWLHRVWRIFLLDLPLSIAASQYSAASDVCYLLLVIDLGSQLPLACWASASQPTIREVKLALFQSVWHPGALDWPLRGIPEILQVPASLVSTDSNQLHEAAWWLVARVQIVDDATQDKILARLSETTAIVQDLFFVGLDEIRQIANSRLMTVKDVQDAVTTWLRKSEKCFAAHRPGLQDTARKQGFALPAFDSPAAGLLLPVGETGVMTLRDGVLADDKFFTAPDFHSAPQQTLHYRAYPYRYDGARPDERMDEAIFLVHPDGALQYLVRQS